MEEIESLINNSVFQVEEMDNLQYKFAHGTTLTIGGFAVPPAMTNYSLRNNNGKVYLETDPEKALSTEPLIITILSRTNPIRLRITKELTNKTLVTLIRG